MIGPREIERLFLRLGVRYGDAWLRKWEGVPPELVAEDWRRVLERISPRAIAYGLDRLPAEFPPTAHQFRELCLGAPRRDEKLLEESPHSPNADAETLRANLARLRAAVGRIGTPDADGLAWARKLEERDREHGGLLEDGARITVGQRELYRGALKHRRHAA